MSPSFVSKIILTVAIIVLIGTAYSMNRDYQDIWILQGLEIPFVMFVVTFAFAFYVEKRVLLRVALAVLGRTIFMLIPAVKYVWFQGPWIDMNVQHALANYVVTNGHIMTSPTIYQVYSDSPLIHLSLAIFSSFLNIPVASSMKYLPVFWSMLFPLLVYIIAKNMFPSESTLLGCALFISAIPISMAQYYVSGSLFGLLLVHFILTILVLMYVKNNRIGFWPILLLSVFVLAAAHSVSSAIFTVIIIILLFLKRFSRLGISSFLSNTKVLTLVLIGLAWFVFRAYGTLQTILHVYLVEVRSGTTPVSQRIGTGSFEVLRSNPVAAITSFVVIYGADVLFLLLTFVGLLLMFRSQKRLNQVSIFITVFYSIVIVLGVVSVALQVGAPRLLWVAEKLFPIFSSVFILGVYRKKTWFRKLTVVVVFSLIIFLATIEFYGYQPLVPSANVLSKFKDLPSSVQMSYSGLVNSIFQRRMIIFAENYISGKVAAVFPITTQVLGLTDAIFSLAVVSYDPLDSNFTKPYYDYLLIHMPGPAGDYAGTPDLSVNDPVQVSNYVSNQTIIYTNGESYILANRP
jgi:hypothetical protein